jgi:hypothetical protein
MELVAVGLVGQKVGGVVVRYEREPRQTIGVRLERNEGGFRSNGTDIPPPTLWCHSPRKRGMKPQ